MPRYLDEQTNVDFTYDEYEHGHYTKVLFASRPKGMKLVNTYGHRYPSLVNWKTEKFPWVEVSATDLTVGHRFGEHDRTYPYKYELNSE